MAAREERKVVTVLFADLVGSTSLGERLDPEEVKLVVGEAVARVVREVEELGGYVKDLAGDGVLSFFGAPVTHEDDAERAVRAGLRIAETIGDYAREVARAWGVDGVGVRVGICTGPVVLGQIGSGARIEYAAFGDTVNTAARLQSAAAPGSVLVDGPTHRLVEPLFDWRGHRELELRGKADPVVAHEAGRPLRVAARARDAALVGRERELAAAAELVERVRAGGGGVLVFTGEPGIGKSRLLAELRDAFDGLWLEGRCVSYGEGLSLWPFRELLRDWLGLNVDEPELRVRVSLRRALDDLFAERGAELYPYLAFGLDLDLEPEARASLTALSPEARQYRTFEVVTELLARLAADRPVVVAVEDLHWADATSLVLLERLLPVAESDAVLFAITQRQERDHGSWRFLEQAGREYPHLLRHLELQPLGETAEHDLLRALIGGSLPAEFERRLLDAANGNPFFLEELVRSLADAGALVRDDGRWRLDHEVPIEIPQTIEKVILARIDRLPQESHEVLVAASALGRRFGLPLLRGVHGADVETPLHDLQRADLVRTARRWPEPEYTFKHVLIQEAAYGTLLAEQRRQLHRKAAEWLEQRYAEADEPAALLARHWLAAADEEKAIGYLVRAGDKARSDWALDEAIEHYRELLPLLERRGERQEMALVLLKLGLALHTALRFREANDVYQRAFDLWEPRAAHPAPTATLRVAMPAVPAQPDPPRSYMLPDIQLQMALFDRLVERWPEATIVPSLAERWEIADDGLRYVFRLRDGLTWSDGRPLTAHDVEFAIKRCLDPSRPGVSVAIYFVLEHAQDYALGRSGDAARIGVRALDDRTVEFRLAAPAPYFLSVVNRPDAGPQPRHAIERAGDAWADPERQIVSGAFVQAERTGDRVVLERRDVRRSGNVARVEIVRTTAAEAEAAYARGAVDLTAFHSFETAEDDVLAVAYAGTWYLVFDHAAEPFDDVELRRALAAAIDRTRLAEAVPPGGVVATGGLVPPALQGHTPEIAPRYEPETARARLAASGFDGELVLLGTARAAEAMQAVGRSWSDTLGLAANVEVLEPASFELRPGAVGLLAWYPGYPDPEYFLRLLLHSEAADNAGRWRHTAFDELIERARHEADGRRRLELFHDADRMATADEVAVIPLYYVGSRYYVKPWLRGWWEFGKSWPSFADLAIDEDAQPAR